MTARVRAMTPVLVLALGSTGCLATPDPAADPAPHEAGRSLDAGVATRAGAPTAERPTGLVLPSGRLVPVERAVTAREGRLEVPDDVRRAGWWPGGPRLGDPFGSTLVAGHVDATRQGLGAFAELLGARPGQRVRLRSRHLEQTFTVRSLRLVPRGRIGAEAADIYSVRGDRRLTLVTCAPPYLAARGGYQNLAVVTARASSDVRERGAR
jgi:hypothetical protein